MGGGGGEEEEGGMGEMTTQSCSSHFSMSSIQSVCNLTGQKLCPFHKYLNLSLMGI